MSDHIPNVSVLMTTYKNDQAAIGRAVDSILKQTYADLELILIFEPNDPATPLIRQKYKDPRLVLIENEKRLGRSESYNLGLRLAKGRYLARMDADDYSYADRLERQLAYFREHPDAAVIGTNIRILDNEGRQVGFRNFPVDHTGIMRALTFINPMCHPTIIWDRDKVGRDVQFDLRFSRFCDDLELWMRFMGQGHKFANLPEILLDYQQINEHTRPRENWILNLAARRLHWRLGLRHPRLFIGLLAFQVLTLLPGSMIDRLTGRSVLSDKFRHVEN